MATTDYDYRAIVDDLDRKRDELRAQLERVEAAIRSVEALIGPVPEPLRPVSSGLIRDSEVPIAAVLQPLVRRHDYVKPAIRQAKLLEVITAKGPISVHALRQNEPFKTWGNIVHSDMQALRKRGQVVCLGDGWQTMECYERKRKALADTPALERPAQFVVNDATSRNHPGKAGDEFETVWRPGRDSPSLTGQAPGLGSTLAAEAFVGTRGKRK